MMQRFVRIRLDGIIHHAELLGDELALLSTAPWLGGVSTGQRLALARAQLCCPVAPSKIIGVGRNFSAHAREMGNHAPDTPLTFLKAPSSLTDPGAPVVLPAASKHVAYEGELGVVIGRRARKVSEAQALDHVFGLTVACDTTARDLQELDDQWTRAKGFDTFCPLARTITCGVSPNQLELTTTVNGQLRQSASTSLMVFSVARIIEFVSGVMTLEAGDLILMGTPEGVGPLHAGDNVKIQISELDDLEFDVVDDTP